MPGQPGFFDVDDRTAAEALDIYQVAGTRVKRARPPRKRRLR
jgi:hypothetical protein